MSLKTLKRRVLKVERKVMHKELHLVMVFVGTPELDAQAEESIAQGEAYALKSNRELRIFEVTVE